MRFSHRGRMTNSINSWSNLVFAGLTIRDLFLAVDSNKLSSRLRSRPTLGNKAYLVGSFDLQGCAESRPSFGAYAATNTALFDSANEVLVHRRVRAGNHHRLPIGEFRKRRSRHAKPSAGLPKKLIRLEVLLRHRYALPGPTITLGTDGTLSQKGRQRRNPDIASTMHSTSSLPTLAPIKASESLMLAGKPRKISYDVAAPDPTVVMLEDQSTQQAASRLDSWPRRRAVQLETPIPV